MDTELHNTVWKTENNIEAIIFDMDGVIIDTEAIWKRAEKEVFSSVGVKLTDDLCKVTEKMTTAEVTKFWFDKHPWKDKPLKEVENGVVERVLSLIKEKGKAINGIEKFIKNLKARGYKIGLATNSPAVVIPVVLKKLGLENYFDVTISAENVLEVKPNPAIYLSAANKLNSEPETCIAIEDSFSGLLAAKKAGMKTIAIVENRKDETGYEIADYKINNYDQFEALLPV